MLRHVMAMVIVVAGASVVMADTIAWNAIGGGSFQTNSNWVGGVVPGVADEPRFDLESATPYTVTFAGSADTESLWVETDRVRFDLNQFTYDTASTDLRTLDIGAFAGNVGYLNITDGTFRTTGPQYFNGTRIGGFGQGTLEISDGGNFVAHSNADIAYGLDSTGEVLVRGSDSAWAISEWLIVGREGNATLTIDLAGTVSNRWSRLAEFSGSSGTVVVQGADSTWTNSECVDVGFYGDGLLTISSAGEVSNTCANIGNRLGGTGSVMVTGAGSAWTNTAHLIVGREDHGTLTIENGGAVSNTFSRIGELSGSTGEVTVSGPNSTWSNSADIDVGYEGQGTLTLSGGGQVSNTSGDVAQLAGSVGTVTVTGPGSSWTNSAYVQVGRGGQGTLTIEDGGAVSNTWSMIGRLAGSFGTVAVQGSGSTWNNSENLIVGYESPATLTILNGGGVLSNTWSSIGELSGATGEVTVSGSNSTWSIADFLDVGYQGQGTMTIADGAHVSNTLGAVGNQASAVANATVTGAGSTWTNSGDLSIGKYGTGTLTIESGGQLLSARGFIAEQPGAVGEAMVVGSDARWDVSSDLFVGLHGSGTLTIQDGGEVFTGGQCNIGEGDTAVGEVSVVGSGAYWDIASFLLVGAEGSGTLTVTDGGHVNADYSYVPWYQSGATGSVLVAGAGSMWSLASVLDIGLAGSTGNVTVEDEGAVEVGTWVLLGSGSTLTVSAPGTLTVGLGDPPAEAGTILIRTDGILAGGGGTAIGNIRNHGEMIAWDDGTFALTGTYTQESSGTFVAQIGGPAPGEGLGQLAGSGAVSLDGTLSIMLTNDYVPDLGESFQVITASSRTGVFSEVECQAGYECHVVYGSTDVTVSLEALAVPAVSDWGLVTMVLLTLTTGTLVVARRRPVSSHGT